MSVRPQTTDHRRRHSAFCCSLPAPGRVGPGWFVVCGLLLSGCVTRSLTIKTDPPGANVYVNDQLKGETPLTYDFEWYGWHRLTLRKDGYQRFDDRKQLRAPIYLWIPFDLMVELLPFRIRDQRTWSYTLTPTPALAIPVPPATTTEPGHPAELGGRGSPDTVGGGTEPGTPAPVTTPEASDEAR